MVREGNNKYAKTPEEEIASTKHNQILRLPRRVRAGLLEVVTTTDEVVSNIPVETLKPVKSLKIAGLRRALWNMIYDRGLCHP